ncbi:response regulator transcription factor [Dictyobacter vulcani]|nr:response regulator transcription factor [Dictyobacter vulcani]
MLPTPPNIAGYLNRLLKSCKHEVANQDTPQVVTQQLSKRELEVLRLLAAGSSNQEMAEKMIIGLNTVKTHLSNIYGKLGVRNRIQAVTHARELHIL